jgi:hypothetical protein
MASRNPPIAVKPQQDETTQSAKLARCGVIHRADVVALGLLIAASLLIFAPAVYVVVFLKGSDYATHIFVAQRWVVTGAVQAPHFLYSLLVILVSAMVPMSAYDTAGMIVAVATYVMTAIALYAILRWPGNSGSVRAQAAMSAILALGLMLVWPIIVLAPIDGQVYQGYVATTNVYHNPTIVLLKPIAALLFVFVAAACARPLQNGNRFGTLVVMAALAVLSALAKPNYLICLLPAVGLFILWAEYQRHPYDRAALLLGLVTPGVAVLMWQYLFTYSGAKAVQDHISGIGIAPFAVFGLYSQMLLPKFVLSIAFPMCVYLLYYRASRRDLALNLAWVVFLMGAFQTYFLIEAGPRWADGNFAWSGQIGSFVLFVTSAAFFMRQTAPLWSGGWLLRGWSRPSAVCAIVLGLHLVSGLVLFARSIGPPYPPRQASAVVPCAERVASQRISPVVGPTSAPRGGDEEGHLGEPARSHWLSSAAGGTVAVDVADWRRGKPVHVEPVG